MKTADRRMSSWFDIKASKQVKRKPSLNGTLDISLEMAPQEASTFANGIDISMVSVPSTARARDRYAKPARPIPQNKFALVMFPTIIFSACVAMFVLSVTAMTECKPYLTEEEERLIEVHSYPTKANISLIAMSAFGFLIPVAQYLTNPYASLRRFYKYGVIAGCYYVLFIWAFAEMTAYVSIAAKIKTHFSGIALFYICVALLVFVSVMIVGYMFVPNNPLTRQRIASAAPEDSDDEEEELRGSEITHGAQRNSCSVQTSETRDGNETLHAYLNSLSALDAYSAVNSTSPSQPVPTSALKTAESCRSAAPTRNSRALYTVLDRNSLATVSLHSDSPARADSRASSSTLGLGHRRSLKAASIYSVTYPIADRLLPTTQVTSPGARNSNDSSVYYAAMRDAHNHFSSSGLSITHSRGPSANAATPGSRNSCNLSCVSSTPMSTSSRPTSAHVTSVMSTKSNKRPSVDQYPQTNFERSGDVVENVPKVFNPV